MTIKKTKEISKQTFSEVPEGVDQNTVVLVRNGFQGTLVYVSSKTGETFVWDSFGDDLEMDLKELRVAKSSQKKFFENNWFLFDEEYSWVIPYLGVSQFYKNAISVDGFDEIFKSSPADIKKIVSELNAGQLQSIKYKARKLVADGMIDSMKTITALEECLGIELLER